MIQEILSRFLKIPGVMAVMVVANEGTVVESVATSPIDLPYLGMVLSDVIRASSNIVSLIGEKEIPMLFFEFDNGELLVFPLNNDVSTVIAAKTGANTGLIRYEMKKSREMLVKAL